VPSSAAPLLQADRLERRFGATRALRGVSLTVHRGECHLLVGPNGAGKTTLLRLLAGLARPTVGTVSLDGLPLRQHPELRRRIGFLSHQSQLYDDLSVAENLSFTASLYGLADAEQLSRSRLAAVGLSDRADDAVRGLSRGMVQRVAIARALLHQPALLLLDEPFTGLDPHSIEQVAGLLESERQRSGSGAESPGLVLASHDVPEAWELASHVHLLMRGQWVLTGPREGTLEAFLRRYREVLRG
jgi:heme exporter protein A